MQWSPDGRRIIFNRYRSDGTSLGEFIAPDSVGGPGIRLLPPTNQYNGKPGPSVVSWSPDGTAIVVSGVVDEFPSRSAIYIANSDGTGLTFVTRGNDATLEPSGVTTSSGPPRIVTRALRGSDSAVTWGAYIPIS